MTMDLRGELDAIIATARSGLRGRLVDHPIRSADAQAGIIEPPPGLKPAEDPMLWTNLTLLEAATSAAQAHAVLRAGANRLGASRIDAAATATKGC